MNYLRFLKRSISYYKTSYFSVFIGIIISFMVLAGSLTVGDSVKFSLKRIAQNRTGKINFAILNNTGFFTNKLLHNVSYNTKIKKTVVLKLNGFVIKDGGKLRKNRITILGVDKDFFQFSPRGKTIDFSYSKNEAAVNQKLADQMSLKPGDSLLVKIDKKGFISDELSLTDIKNKHISLKIVIKNIVNSDNFGKFGLNSDQQAPLNIFMPYKHLAQITDLLEYSNMILLSDSKESSLSSFKVNQMVKNSLSPEDLGLIVNKINNTDIIDIKSKSVFIKKDISELLIKEFENPDTIFTYFVNKIEHDNFQTPYSFVAGSQKVTDLYGLEKDEIIVNKWLANDLNLVQGSKIEMTYFGFGRFRKLREESSSFIVKSIIENNNDLSFRKLAPDIPGLMDSNDCRSWESSIPIDFSRIRKKDELYWNDYKGAPKAFIHIDRARELWKNRSGDLTSIRIHDQNSTVEKIVNKIKKIATPQIAGIEIRDIKKDAEDSVKDSLDFGLLFISLSFFLILSSFILAALFFMLLIRKRVSEIGTLKAFGFSSKKIYRIFMTEGMIISFFGGIVGTFAGIGFNYVIIKFLGSIWQGTVGQTQVYFHFSFSTLMNGFFLGIIISFITLFFILKKNLKTQVKDLHSDIFYKSPHPKTLFYVKLITSVFIVSIISTTFLAQKIGQTSQMFPVLFFCAGFLALTILSLLFYLFLCFLDKPLKSGKHTFFKTSLKNCSRSKLSSLSVFITLSCGLFIIISVCSYRMSPLSDTGKRDTGTGGFSYIIETSLPVHSDINLKINRQGYGLNNELSNLEFVQIKTTSGSDAGCLNLNRSQNPVIVGIDTDQLSFRNAFRFVNNEFGLTHSSDIWKALDSYAQKNVIPAAADLNTILWGLGKKPGDIISVKDEAGNKFNLKLFASIANSILQGKIIISLNQFEKFFPAISGSNYILVDGTDNVHLNQKLTYALRDLGADVISAKERLSEFSTVQNTYLSIFMLIGGLGLVIGVFSLGTIMFKNINDRKKEIAVLRAFGFSRKKIISLLFVEYGFLFTAGITAGVISACFAVIPSMISSGYNAPVYSICFFILIIVITGFFSILLSVQHAMGQENETNLTDE